MSIAVRLQCQNPEVAATCQNMLFDTSHQSRATTNGLQIAITCLIVDNSVVA